MIWKKKKRFFFISVPGFSAGKYKGNSSVSISWHFCWKAISSLPFCMQNILCQLIFPLLLCNPDSWAYNYTIVLKKDPSITFCHKFKQPTHQVLMEDIDYRTRNIIWTLLLLFICDGNLKRGYCFSITSSTDFSVPVMMLYAIIWRHWTYQSVFG